VPECSGTLTQYTTYGPTLSSDSSQTLATFPLGPPVGTSLLCLKAEVEQDSANTTQNTTPIIPPGYNARENMGDMAGRNMKNPEPEDKKHTFPGNSGLDEAFSYCSSTLTHASHCMTSDH